MRRRCCCSPGEGEAAIKGGGGRRVSNLQLPVHAPVVEVNREISADEVVESHNVVPAASQNNSRHAVFEQIIRDHRPAQLVIEVPFAPFNSHKKSAYCRGVPRTQPAPKATPAPTHLYS